MEPVEGLGHSPCTSRGSQGTWGAEVGHSSTHVLREPRWALRGHPAVSHPALLCPLCPPSYVPLGVSVTSRVPSSPRRVPSSVPAPARWDALQVQWRPPGGTVVAGAVRALPGDRPGEEGRGDGRGTGRGAGRGEGGRRAWGERADCKERGHGQEATCHDLR